MTSVRLLLMLLLAGCAPRDGRQDADGDGSPAEVDCDDDDPAVYPGAVELCDGRDQDCDGLRDELAADAVPFYPDEDLDGYGQGSPLFACSAPDPTWSTVRGDCDDSDPSVRPGAEERCDERDEDCDGEIDEGGVCGELQCDDGLDDDGDGLTDCADPDCDGACDEVCDDGRDNDRNGAIDCADSACWDASTCEESACGDGIDDELDGLTDCDDPDCWRHPDCPSTLWRVTGGSLSLSRETTLWTERDCAGADCDSGVDRVQEVQAYAITGEVARLQDGAWVTCPWGYDRGRYASRFSDGSRTYQAVLREGFAIAPGCGVSDDRFLPRSLALVGDAVHTLEGQPWFVGDTFEGSVRVSDLDHPERTGTITRDLLFWDPLRPPDRPLGACAAGEPSNGYLDEDSDGVGADGQGLLTCGLDGLLTSAGDCDDDTSSIPAGFEICGNGMDDDCDGTAPDCLGPGGVSPLDRTDWRWDGEANGGVPRAFAVGDLNADGFDDLAVGLPRDDTEGVDAGAVVLLPGGPPDRASLDDGIWLFGEAAGDVAGASVAAAGDHTGDGLDDLLVTAPGTVRDGVARSGSAYIVAAPFTEGSLGDAAGRVEGRGHWLGTTADGLGDVDDDGFDDIAIGAQTDPSAGPNAGAILIFSGPIRGVRIPADAASTLTGRRNDIVGDALAGPGDINGDGRPDLIVGRRMADGSGVEVGAAHLMLAPFPVRASLEDADVTWLGALDEAWAGERVAGAGDVDGDGYRDLLVSAPRTYGVAPRTIAATGEVYLLSGGPGLVDRPLSDATAIFRGDRIYDLAGAGLAGGQDLDGDGLTDVAIGAPGDDRGGAQAGVVAVFSGPLSGRFLLRDADGTYRGAQGVQAGTWIAMPGDLDADGTADLVFTGLSVDGEERGQVFGVLGGPGW